MEEKSIICGLDGYIIYESGKVWSNKSNKYLRPALNKKGYKQLMLSNKTFRVHKLVALAFIPNPENKPQINHIDGNKLNNHFSNLEWCTAKENSKHAWDNGLIVFSEKTRKIFSESRKLRCGEKHYLSKKVINRCTGEIFHSIKEAAKSTEFGECYVAEMLRGKKPNKTALMYK